MKFLLYFAVIIFGLSKTDARRSRYLFEPVFDPILELGGRVVGGVTNLAGEVIGDALSSGTRVMDRFGMGSMAGPAANVGGKLSGAAIETFGSGAKNFLKTGASLFGSSRGRHGAQFARKGTEHGAHLARHGGYRAKQIGLRYGSDSDSEEVRYGHYFGGNRRHNRRGSRHSGSNSGSSSDSDSFENNYGGRYGPHRYYDSSEQYGGDSRENHRNNDYYD